MPSNPKVSVIVPTYNSAATLDACLDSIRKQSYLDIELIVVDNNSKDSTKKIAKKYTDLVFNKGPERSTQRNYGVAKSKGQWVAIIDSDMVLAENVIQECVDVANLNESIGGVVIPEESFGEGFWARCKQLERSFYVGISWMEAARFIRKDIYIKLGGYNEALVSGEDWDLSQRVSREAVLSRVGSFIMHNEGNLKLGKTLKKKYYYAQKFTKYLESNKATEEINAQTGIVQRYKLFLSQPGRLFKNPIIGVGMLFMKTCEFGFGGFGFILTKLKGKSSI